MLFFRTDENEQQEIYMDYYTGKAMVHSGVQYCVWINKIKERKIENEDEEKITWIL